MIITYCKLLIVMLMLVLSSCGGRNDANNTITIFHAGSLSYPMRQLISAFNAENPGIRILTESSGSLAAARKITDLNRICDIFASADYIVIEELLFPYYANWHIAFARNELAIVFSPESRYAGEITPYNWHEILLRPNVRYARSDPHSDPCGYRTLLVWQLAEKYYNIPGLYSKFLAKDYRFIRPKSVDLLALLETRTVDYLFLYKSVAKQHGLKFIPLPDSINLGNPLLTEHYRQVSVTVRGTAPGDSITFYGEPMIYALTIPHQAPNKKLAEQFLEFVLHPDKGMRIMYECGQPPLIPGLAAGYDYIEHRLQKFVVPYF